MNEHGNGPDHDLADARRRAEKLLQDREEDLPGPPSAALANRLIHELRVHQIELEMQCEELRASRAEAERARERYAPA